MIIYHDKFILAIIFHIIEFMIMLLLYGLFNLVVDGVDLY